MPGRPDAEAALYMRGRIDKSYLNWRGAAYDRLQFIQNKIPY